MAAKGSRKDDTDNYCAIFSYILPLHGLPKKEKGKKKVNINTNSDLRQKCKEIICIAINKREDWKLEFESRLNSSGFEDMDKIGEFLIEVLKATTDILKGNHLARELMTLAVYCEFMLFLNYKRIEFDFMQMLEACKLCSWKQIPDNSEGLSVRELFGFPYDLYNILQVRDLVTQYATPYENPDASKRFRMLRDLKGRSNEEMAKCIDNTQNPTAVLDECFESQAMLPGDRDSPEPLECSGSRIREERKRNSGRSNRTSGLTIKSDIGSKCGSEVRQRKTSSHLEIKSFDTSRNIGIDQGECESSKPLNCSESRIRKVRKRSRRRSNQTSGWTIKSDIGSRSEVRQRKTSSHLELKPFDPSRNLGIDRGDHESSNPHEWSGSSTLEEREESIRGRLTPSTDIKSEVRQIRTSSQLGIEPLETSGSNIGRKEKNRKRSTRSASIVEQRTGNRTRTFSELAIEDRLGQMSLFDDGPSKD